MSDADYKFLKNYDTHDYTQDELNFENTVACMKNIGLKDNLEDIFACLFAILNLGNFEEIYDWAKDAELTIPDNEGWLKNSAEALKIDIDKLKLAITKEYDSNN